LGFFLLQAGDFLDVAIETALRGEDRRAGGSGNSKGQGRCL
jgi:hypothetical protein